MYRPKYLFAFSVVCLLILSSCKDSNPVGPQSCTEEIDGACWTSLGLDGFWVTALTNTPWGLYAGTHEKGVFRYNPDHRQWEALGLDHAIISSIIYVATDTPRLVVGVYPYSDEITEAAAFASEDGGKTWIPWDGGRAEAQGNRAWAYSLAVDPTNPYRLFMGQNYEILRSENGGKTWTYVVGNSDGAGGAIHALAISPNGDGQVWAGGVNSIFSAYILRSESSGNSWQRFWPNPRREEGIHEENAIHSIVVDPFNSDRVFAGMKFGYIVRSLDGGKSWHQVFQTPGKGFVLDMKYINGQLFATAQENVRTVDDGRRHPLSDLSLYRADDGGDTWKAISVPEGIAGGSALTQGVNSSVLIATRGTGVWRLDT